MNGVSRDAKYGTTRSDAASVHEFVKGFQAAESAKVVKPLLGAAAGGILAYTAYWSRGKR